MYAGGGKSRGPYLCMMWWGWEGGGGVGVAEKNFGATPFDTHVASIISKLN